ncbi:glycosyltransferase family 4 protein [Maritimibacter sp. UBA3975]|uniref:glycosyltransferase family 4 protein n=1 Tax=Maritimibacter sp. UBA3975 TaxID=1946833 RepID=UPI0025C0130A|nr:glycosyltransferase family 4 protein [Maritimibacter sp. UBA3975]
MNDASIARGGATSLALLAAEDFVARGHEVIWIAGDSGHGPELDALGIEVVALGGQPLLDLPSHTALHAGIRNGAARDLVARFVAERDTPGTVYHTHSWAQIFSPELFSALAPVSRRTVIHAHDVFLACPNGVYMDYRHDKVCTRVPLSADCLATHCDKRSYPQKLWRVLRQANLRRHLRDGSGWGAILVLHPEMTERLTRAGYREDRVRVVRNPVVPFSETRIAAEDNRSLVYVGRLEPDKGVGTLAEASARTGVPVTLIGDGPMRPMLEAMDAPLTLTGWADRDRIGGLVRDARALVMPSRHPEPFALVIAEAAASGLPVLVSDTALMAREVAENGLGHAVNIADPARLDAALAGMMETPDAEVRAMSERGFGGEARLGLTRSEWIDAQEAEYDRLLGSLRASAA